MHRNDLIKISFALNSPCPVWILTVLWTEALQVPTEDWRPPTWKSKSRVSEAFWTQCRQHTSSFRPLLPHDVLHVGRVAKKTFWGPFFLNVCTCKAKETVQKSRSILDGSPPPLTGKDRGNTTLHPVTHLLDASVRPPSGSWSHVCPNCTLYVNEPARLASKRNALP